MSVLTLLAVLVALTGCNQGTSDGPEAAGPASEQRAAETFSLDVPMLSTKLHQGETETVTVGIKRATNMEGDVTLEFEGLPAGVTIDPIRPEIKREGTEAKITLRATEDASQGDFTVKVTGHPTKGSNVSDVLKLTIAKQPTDKAADAATEAAKDKREEYVLEARKLLEELDAEYEELVDRAAEASGEAKKDLEAKLAQAKEKRDAAARKLDELQWANADRWDKVKKDVENAFDELATMFE